MRINQSSNLFGKSVLGSCKAYTMVLNCKYGRKCSRADA